MAGGDLELRVAWQQHLGTSAAADRWLESLLARYRERGRHHHDDRHVRWVVRHVLALCERHAADDLGAVVAAAFFHDAVYDPARSDNEARSAELAERVLAEIGWPAERRSRVAAMVAATAGHDIAGLDRDARTLVAADLAVLATEPSQYADYVRAVRREYAHVDDVAWRAGRSAVLAALLARDHLFPPELELSAWERRARANITAELAALSDRSSQDGS